MSRSWWAKLFLLIAVTAGAAVYVAPTVFNLDSQNSKFFFKQKINLGLDLQGGVYMVLGVDFKKVFADVAVRLADNLAEDLKKKSIDCGTPALIKETRSTDDPMLSVECTSADAKAKLYQTVKKDYDTFRITEDKGNVYHFGLSKLYKDTVREKTISQSIEVVRNRIDEFGVAEPVITSQGTDRLSVELPGIKDVERAKELIGRTARLEFKLVSNEKSPDEVAALVSEIEAKNGLAYKEGARFSDYVRKINEVAHDKLPAGTEIAFEREGRRSSTSSGEGRLGRIAHLLRSKADITGDDLKDAYVQIDPQDNRPQVGLSFNSKGAESFDRVTGENLHRQLAIVLDGIVHSAPVIQSRISQGRAQITLGYGDYNTLLGEAKDLAIVLRAGALPAQLEFLEQRVVGPSLGNDSIQRAKLASIIGCFAVFLFMMIYYRMSGVIADISLILNVLFVLAILVGMDATLTLPGIAGIALTVGIAVDSNVVIYERIREELKAGKGAKAAVDSGFAKAFRTILDANVTNAIAAIVLFNYGTGPVKGFAVTLMIGIVTTLFTAVFVCRLLFDWYLDKFDVKELSI